MRKKGLEPLRPFGHQLLRLARLPIPPLPRWNPEYSICLRFRAFRCSTFDDIPRCTRRRHFPPLRLLSPRTFVSLRGKCPT
jgi:hypothetical protein